LNCIKQRTARVHDQPTRVLGNFAHAISNGRAFFQFHNFAAAVVTQLAKLAASVQTLPDIFHYSTIQYAWAKQFRLLAVSVAELFLFSRPFAALSCHTNT
jgi:hypothetical protein